jgi:hypothetical protein
MSFDIIKHFIARFSRSGIEMAVPLFEYQIQVLKWLSSDDNLVLAESKYVSHHDEPVFDNLADLRSRICKPSQASPNMYDASDLPGHYLYPEAVSLQA